MRRAALERGDIERYRHLLALDEAFTLMSPMGSFSSRGNRWHGEQWLLAHRHADPLGEAISVERSAAPARGLAMPCLEAPDGCPRRSALLAVRPGASS